MFVLKYLPKGLENWVRQWANEHFENQKARENKTFVEMILFFKYNQELYEKWKKDKEIQEILKKDLME